MDVHQNAHLTPKGREAMVCAVMDEAMTKAQAARRFKTTAKTVAKWLGRFRAEGIAGLADRSSRPIPRQAKRLGPPAKRSRSCAGLVARMDHIAQELGLSRADRQPYSQAAWPQPVVRPRAQPSHARAMSAKRQANHPYGHQEARSLQSCRPSHHRRSQAPEQQRHNGTAPGWEYVHVAIDDHSRIGFADIFPNEKKESAVAFLEAAVTYFCHPRRYHHPRHDRQWIMLQIQGLPRCLPKAHHQAYPHQTLHAPDQRQGRTLHPDNVARMGLRKPNSTTQTSEKQICRNGSTATTGIDPMPASSTNTNQPTRPEPGQPVEASQLELAAPIEEQN